jgi:hypothetical protein
VVKRFPDSAAKRWNETKADDPVVRYDVSSLLKTLADQTRFKMEAEKKDPGAVPEYRRPKLLMPELDSISGEETVTLRADFYDKAISTEDLFRSYCERRKETAQERRKSKTRCPKQDEEDTSLSTLLAGLKGHEDAKPKDQAPPPPETRPVSTESPTASREGPAPGAGSRSTKPERATATSRSPALLDASFADTDTDW